jgi:nitrite reductase (NADH) small subunit
MKQERRWVRITHCRNIPLREGRSVKVAGREIAIFNLGDRFLAIDNHCPHEGGPLSEGIIAGVTVVCPLHAWKVNLETGIARDTAALHHCVETFRTRVEEGIVLLELPAEFTLPQACAVARIDLCTPLSQLETIAEASD